MKGHESILGFRVIRLGLGWLTACLVVAGAGREGAADPIRPNLIFMMADDLGLGDLGCYGQESILTPNIDRLAAEGTRFTHVYAGAAVCAPSRCVLMTGLHTGHARVRDNHGKRTTIPVEEQGQPNRIPLEPDDLTIAEVLRQAGYATAIFGKWGLGEPGSTGVPTRQGFDRWLGFLNQDHAVDYFTPYLWEGETRLSIPANEGGRRGQYVHDLFADRAVAFLAENRDRPFFLYVPFTIPHLDFEVPDLGPYADKPWSDAEKTYAAMVTRMDGDVGRIMAKVRELGLDGQTLVFFCSDNGGPGTTDKYRYRAQLPICLGLRGQKGSFYEGGIRVPMIARWPGKVPSGAVSDQVWSFADVLPTATDLASCPTPPGLDGQSILRTLLGQAQDLGDRFFYWENLKGQACRLGRWKAVRPRFGGELALFDLERDSREAHDLAADQPEILATLETRMAAARVPSPYYPHEPADR